MAATGTLDLAHRLEKQKAILAREAASLRRGNFLTLLIGVLALGALAFYFYWGYSQFSEVMEHEKLADFVVIQIDDRIPELRKSLEEETKKAAPNWAGSLSKQLQDNVPNARKKLEDYVVDKVKTTLNDGTVLTEQQFTKFLKDNRETIRKDIQELAKNPTLSTEAVAELEKILEAQLNADLKTNAKELLAILGALNVKLTKLAKNAKLDKTELIERRLAMIARRLQSEQVSTSTPAIDAAPAAGASIRKAGPKIDPALVKKAQESNAEAAKADAPKTDAPKPADPPKTDTPKTDAPKPADPPKTDEKPKS